MKIDLNSLSATRTLETLLKRAKDDLVEKTTNEWKVEAKKILKEEIIASLERGQSPVEGGGGGSSGTPRFQEYSPSYKEAINKGRYKQFDKKVRPVNLILSGKMINSMVFKDKKEGISIDFTDEKFQYHNFLGAGKSHVIRPILPIGDQKFSAVITGKLLTSFVNLFNKNKKRG